jgi:hypothetical protein
VNAADRFTAGSFEEALAAARADALPSETNTLGFFAKQYQEDEGCSFREALECLAFGVVGDDGMGWTTKVLAAVRVVRHCDGSMECVDPDDARDEPSEGMTARAFGAWSESRADHAEACEGGAA